MKALASPRIVLGSSACLRTALVTTVMALLAPVTAVAQQPSSVPGLVVSTPPPTGPTPSMPGLVVSTPSPQSGIAPPSPAIVAPAASQKARPKPTAPKSTASTAENAAPAKGPQGIAALINDEPVTAFEVDRLARFMALSTNISDRAKANMQARAQDPRTNDRLKAILQETIQTNQGKSREEVIAAFEVRKKQFVMNLQREAVDNARASVIPTLRKRALDELIEDRLKYQEAKRLSIAVGDDDMERAFKGVAERNKMSVQDFANHIKAQGADPVVMKGRLKTQIVWREVIRRRFGHTIAISNREVDKLVASSATGNEAMVELQLHKLTLATGGSSDQKIVAQRYEEAERIRSKFSGCKATSALAKSGNAKFEDLGYRKVASLEDPARTLLLNARDGEMIPPNPTASGVELYAVCGRRAAKLDEQKRQAAESELQVKEFDRIAQRHILDLRKDALIEIR